MGRYIPGHAAHHHQVRRPWGARQHPAAGRGAGVPITPFWIWPTHLRLSSQFPHGASSTVVSWCDEEAGGGEREGDSHAGENLQLWPVGGDGPQMHLFQREPTLENTVQSPPSPQMWISCISCEKGRSDNPGPTRVTLLVAPGGWPALSRGPWSQDSRTCICPATLLFGLARGRVGVEVWPRVKSVQGPILCDLGP